MEKFLLIVLVGYRPRHRFLLVSHDMSTSWSKNFDVYSTQHLNHVAVLKAGGIQHNWLWYFKRKMVNRSTCGAILEQKLLTSSLLENFQVAATVAATGNMQRSQISWVLWPLRRRGSTLMSCRWWSASSRTMASRKRWIWANSAQFIESFHVW